MENTLSIHPFTASTGRPGPFRLQHIYENQQGEKCAHCSARIVVCCVIADGAGGSFTVGSTCVYKTYDAGLSASVRIAVRARGKLAKADARQARAQAHLDKYPAWAAEEISEAEEAIRSVAELGEIERFTPEHVASYAEFMGEFVTLDFVANTYARNYSGDFSFMRDMHAALMKWGDLSPAQCKGVLNCMLAATRRAERAQLRERERAEREALPELADGMYRLDGQIFKVQHAIHGSGRQYAKALIRDDDTDPDSGWHFEYVAGAVYKLRAEHALTLEEAKAFGALYGTCCVCGRTLTDENSIALGIGPVCASKFAL